MKFQKCNFYDKCHICELEKEKDFGALLNRLIFAPQLIQNEAERFKRFS